MIRTTSCCAIWCLVQLSLLQSCKTEPTGEDGKVLSEESEEVPVYDTLKSVSDSLGMKSYVLNNFGFQSERQWLLLAHIGVDFVVEELRSTEGMTFCWYFGRHPAYPDYAMKTYVEWQEREMDEGPLPYAPDFRKDFYEEYYESPSKEDSTRVDSMIIRMHQFPDKTIWLQRPVNATDRTTDIGIVFKDEEVRFHLFMEARSEADIEALFLLAKSVRRAS